MQRHVVVIRARHDEQGRLVGQLVDVLDDQRIPFGSVAELWSRLMECLRLPDGTPFPGDPETPLTSEE
jgi:hypothetical protein